MQRMAARVFACLLVSESGALSSAELGERLRVSPAAVSGAVRMLAGVHIVSREREPGSRRELYRLHSDIWYQTISERDAFVMRWIGTFQEGAQALGPQTPAGRRLLESVEFFRFLEQELRNIMERWQAHREALRHPDSGAGSDSGSGDSGSGPSDSGARSDSDAGAGG
ncbi:MarR family transcriptional regulator [Streptomyces sp. XM4193]|nr:MarR family transcriptional regulator [Streptomyces sp. XM4193]MCK1794952.1 MarR family transcriptional regulator [Streptomyces sp. XM4193]